MPTVAVLCEFPTLLGGERSWLAVLPAIRGAGFVPLVLAPPSGPLALALKSAGVQHIGWSLCDRNGRRRELPALREELHALLNDLQPELVHANSLSMTRLAGPVVRERGLPGLGSLRDIVRLSRRAARDVNCMPRLLAVSNATRRFHAAQGIDAARVHVLVNGVDLQEFARPLAHQPIREELSLPRSTLLVVTIGQIGMRKGTDVFVELARRVLARRRDVHFLIVGERTSRKEEAVQLETALRSQASLPECRGHVHFLGTRGDVAGILGDADLIVHAARQEPLGRVLLEASAAQRAVIATDVGGTREIFPSETASAVLVPPCEPEGVRNSELLASTLRLLDDPATRNSLGRAARRRAEQAFDVTRAGAGLAQHYRDTLATVAHESPHTLGNRPAGS